MKNIHQSILDFVLYYAQKLKNEVVLSVLTKQKIDNEAEARAVLLFLNDMSNRVIIDVKHDVVVLNRKVQTSDAEKVCNVVEGYIEDSGYAYLVELELVKFEKEFLNY